MNVLILASSGVVDRCRGGGGACPHLNRALRPLSGGRRWEVGLGCRGISAGDLNSAALRMTRLGTISRAVWRCVRSARVLCVWGGTCVLSQKQNWHVPLRLSARPDTS